jgi:O-antigen/teichoic acid export membrane protein
VLISLGFGLAGYLAAQIMSGLLVLVLLANYVWRMTPAPARQLRGSLRLEKKIVSFSAAAFTVAAVEFILSQADKIVLGYYLKPAQVGIYAVAMALVGFVPIALQSVNQIFSPTIAELHALGDRVLLQRLYSTLTKWILALTLPLALTIVVFARPFMGIFGAVFEAGAVVLVVGTAGQLVNCAVGSVGYLLLMSGHQNQIVRIQAVNAVLIIGLSVVLVQRYGIFGAALASAIALSVTNLWSLAAVHRRLQLFPYTSEYLKLIAPCAIAAVALFALRYFSGARATWTIAVGGVFLAYGTFLGTFVASGLGSEDRVLAQAAWSRLELNFLKGTRDQ